LKAGLKQRTGFQQALEIAPQPSWTDQKATKTKVGYTIEMA
jgi:hypothetical protein